MERKRNNPTSFTMFTLLLGLLSQNLVIPVISTTTTIEDHNSPDPHAGTDLSNSLCNSLTPLYILFHYLCKIEDIISLLATVGHLLSNLKYEGSKALKRSFLNI